mgnify:FL=1|jgi:hypothetical protein
MKNLIALIVALTLGVVAVGAFYWIVGHIFWIVFEITKFVVALLIAVPIFFYIRRRLLR